MSELKATESGLNTLQKVATEIFDIVAVKELKVVWVLKRLNILGLGITAVGGCLVIS